MKFVIATHNQGKVVEFKRMLEPMGIEVVTAQLSEPEETGKTFMENAFIKPRPPARRRACPPWPMTPACAWTTWTGPRAFTPPGSPSPASAA